MLDKVVIEYFTEDGPYLIELSVIITKWLDSKDSSKDGSMKGFLDFIKNNYPDFFTKPMSEFLRRRYNVETKSKTTPGCNARSS